jgi:hypothetical protein
MTLTRARFLFVYAQLLHTDAIFMHLAFARILT